MSQLWWASSLFCVYGCVNVLVWVCAYAAFEATRFYNVSESSPLARELCDGPTCNEVESSTNQWIGEMYAMSFIIHLHLTSNSLWQRNDPAGFVQASQCNNVFGCLEEEQFERCTCYRDCGYDGEPVCGSDGQLYQNQCQMEVFACRNGTRIKQVPLSQCPKSKKLSHISWYLVQRSGTAASQQSIIISCWCLHTTPAWFQTFECPTTCQICPAIYVGVPLMTVSSSFTNSRPIRLVV